MCKLKKYIQNTKIQRVFYAILFLLCNYAILPTVIQSTWSNSSFGVPYFHLWLVLSVILLYQIFFNNVVGWLVFFILYLTLAIYGVIMGFSDAFVNYGTKYSEKDVLLYVIICIILYVPVGWFIYLIKPKKRK